MHLLGAIQEVHFFLAWLSYRNHLLSSMISVEMMVQDVCQVLHFLF